MVVTSLIRAGGALVKAGAKAGKNNKRRGDNSRRTNTNTHTRRQQDKRTMDAEWSHRDDSNPSNPVVRPKTISGNPVSKALDRRHDYRMKYGKQIETSKALTSGTANIGGSIAIDSYMDQQAAEEYADAQEAYAKEYADAAIKKAEIEAEAQKNGSNEFTYNENKHWVIEGLTPLQNGGASKTVDPQYENKY